MPLVGVRTRAAVDRSLTTLASRSIQAREHIPTLPFVTQLLGVDVHVEQLELAGERDILAVCRRGEERHKVRLIDWPLPSPRSAGWEWIEACRYWMRGFGSG